MATFLKNWACAVIGEKKGPSQRPRDVGGGEIVFWQKNDQSAHNAHFKIGAFYVPKIRSPCPRDDGGDGRRFESRSAQSAHESHFFDDPDMRVKAGPRSPRDHGKGRRTCDMATWRDEMTWDLGTQKN